MKYVWDLDREIANIRKHGYSFSSAIEAFSDKDGFALEDVKHSDVEHRFYWLGKDTTGTILTVRYVRRGTSIRIFGCANWREFRKVYYEKTKNK